MCVYRVCMHVVGSMGYAYMCTCMHTCVHVCIHMYIGYAYMCGAAARDVRTKTHASVSSVRTEATSGRTSGRLFNRML